MLLRSLEEAPGGQEQVAAHQEAGGRGLEHQVHRGASREEADWRQSQGIPVADPQPVEDLRREETLA